MNNKFKINYLKLEHYYLNSDDMNDNTPLTTSVELNSNYDFESEKLVWNKKIINTFLDSTQESGKRVEVISDNSEDIEEIISQIVNHDLRELKNNYFTDSAPYNFTHWEITYNTYFRIVGTYDQEVVQFSEISRLLKFDEIIKKNKKSSTTIET